MSEEEAPRLVSVAFVAEFFKVSEQTVRNWIKEGRLPNTVQIGRQYRVVWADVQRILHGRYGDGDLSVSPLDPPEVA